MDLPVVNHRDYLAKIGDDHKFPINKFGELANLLINKNSIYETPQNVYITKKKYSLDIDNYSDLKINGSKQN